jgi:HD-like signal output (HDOD) protein
VFRERIVPNASVFGIQTGNRHLAVPQRFQLEMADDLPDVPALPETLLQMELQLHEFSIDLRAISQLILNDAGATLQILRLAARESGGTDGWPARIEDCISFLGLDACLQAAGRRTVLSEARHRGVIEVWAHGREIAQFCRKQAASTDGSIHPEEAYLAGLTHILGVMPGVLGWQWPENGSNWAERGLRLAQTWALPRCVQEFFAEAERPGADAHWTGLVRKAHRAARLSPRCPMCDLSGPQLCG